MGSRGRGAGSDRANGSARDVAGPPVVGKDVGTGGEGEPDEVEAAGDLRSVAERDAADGTVWVADYLAHAARVDGAWPAGHTEKLMSGRSAGRYMYRQLDVEIRTHAAGAVAVAGRGLTATRLGVSCGGGRPKRDEG